MGDTRRYENAVATMFGNAAFGALRVTSSSSVLVSSRIHSLTDGATERNSAGQFFAGIPASFAIGSGQSTTVLGVYQTSPASDSDFRYNFGFVETTGGGATVRVTAFDEMGGEVGSRSYTLGGWEARQQKITDLLPGVNETNLRLEVEVTGIRHDAFAEANRIPVEEDKPDAERGRYLHAEAFGLPAELAIGQDAD